MQEMINTLITKREAIMSAVVSIQNNIDKKLTLRMIRSKLKKTEAMKTSWY